MNRSESLKELTAAIVKVQAIMKPAVKDAQNPHLKNRYADLTSVWDSCRDPLTSNGLAVFQPATATGNAVSVETLLVHVSGEWMSEVLNLDARDSSPQSIGSAITYARRYGLSSMIGICSEDDDGDASTPRPGEHAAPAHQPQRQAPARPNGHQPQAAQPRQHDGPPRSGKALFAWSKDMEQRHDVGLLKFLNAWGKLQDFPGRMVDWDAEMVGLAHAEAMRKLGSMRSPEEVETSQERQPGEEG